MTIFRNSDPVSSFAWRPRPPSSRFHCGAASEQRALSSIPWTRSLLAQPELNGLRRGEKMLNHPSSRAGVRTALLLTQGGTAPAATRARQGVSSS